MTPPNPSRRDLANLKRLIDGEPRDFSKTAIDMHPRLGDEARFLKVQNAELFRAHSAVSIALRNERQRSRNRLTWASIWLAWAAVMLALNLLLLRAAGL